MKIVELLSEFVLSCCFQLRLQQALHALIDLIKWTFSPLAALMDEQAVCRQTFSYLTQSTRALLIYISQNDPRSEFPLERCSPRYMHPSEVHPH